jgi:hypothetical protein
MIVLVMALVTTRATLTTAFAPTTSTTTRVPLAPSLKSRTSPLQVASADNNKDFDIDTVVQETVAEHDSFLQRCKQLCQERNLPFEKVKNARDLASVHNSPIQPGRVFRMGRVSDATDADIELLLGENKLRLQTLVDLRSPTELKDDLTLLRPQIFGNFTSVLWKEQGRGADGCVKELQEGDFPVPKRFWKKGDKKHSKDAVGAQEVDRATFELHSIMELPTTQDEELGEGEEELCTLDCDDPETTTPAVAIIDTNKPPRKERHFVSLMNEFKYVKGTVSKLRKRDLTKAILKSPGALLSKRVRSSVKKPFLDEINDGGLPMLNELLLRFGAPGIKYVLELIADRNRHPITFYCTAGKDRTGMIAAILLGLTGVDVDDIVEDYSLSANVYAEMNDHQAMVGALSQRNLDAKTFLGAPPVVMRDTLAAINEVYGSVEGYCTWIGFGPEKQEKLKKAMLDP